MPKNIHEIPYFKIIKEAFALTWKNRYLWWFGFFAILSNAASFNYSNSNPEEKHLVQNLVSAPQYTQWLMVAAVVGVALVIIIVVMHIISRGALISSIEKIKKNQPVTFKSGFRDGKKYFGKIFIVAFLSTILVLGAFLILAPPVVFLFLNRNYLIGVLMAIVALTIFIPLIVLVAYLRIFGYLYAVLGGLKPWVAIEMAYDLFRKNVTASLIMALLFIPINIILFLTVIFAIIPIALVILPLGILFFILMGKIGAGIAGVIGLSILVAFFILLYSFAEVFSQAIWILFFHEIAKSEEKEIIIEPLLEIEPLPKPLPTINSEVE